MKRNLFLGLTVAAPLLFCSYQVKSQAPPSPELPKYEVAADFSTLSLDSGTNLAGAGGRFTYNLNKHLALEAAGYFFPGKCEGCTGEVTGRIVEGLFGVKAGHRFKKWGIFGKVRPGFATFSRGGFNVKPFISGGAQTNCFGPSPTNPFPCFTIEQTRVTNPVFDVGGVLEFYPSKRIVLRFDGGDTIIHSPQRSFNTLFGNPLDPSAPPVLTPVTAPAQTRHTFQFIAGVGFRF